MLRSTTVVCEGMRVGGKGRAFVLGPLVAVIVALLIVLVVAAGPAHGRLPIGHSFTVNSTADLADANLENSLCDVDLAATGNQCTLRAAIQEANDTPNGTFEGNTFSDTIRFNIPGAGVKTINVGSSGLGALPVIFDPVTIDGYTQPGASPNTLARGTNAVLLVELKGPTSFATDGLSLSINFAGDSASGSVVKGLVINRFQAAGLDLMGVQGIRVEGNFIGTDPSGETAVGNGLGVSLDAESSTLGGPSPASRNLISGNDSDGVSLGLSDSSKVQGNLIGTDKDGTSDLGNGDSGVNVFARNGAVVGGTDTDPKDANNPANTIAFNGGDGVEVIGIDNSILRNSIFSNGGLGIDLKGGIENTAGATANDGGTANDSDTGSNGLQNKPNLASALTSSGTTTIRAVLDTKPTTFCTVQFFSQGGGNEGKKFIGEQQLNTDSDGRVTFTFSPGNAVAVGQKITATATGPEGTSEFSAPREVNAS